MRDRLFTDALRFYLQSKNASEEELENTPERFIRAMDEMTQGYNVDVAEFLSSPFDYECDEMIVLRGMPFSSLCAHHLLPFRGTASVGYLPDGKRVVGLSKIARVVNAFAQRLQMQEQMTAQIAESMVQHLKPLGVAVVIKAVHQCMELRGVKTPAETVTSSMLGAFRDHEVRAEFLSLVG